MSNWVDLSEGVNEDFLREHATVGKTFGFQQEDTVQHYRVMRINKKSGKYWAKRINLMSKEESEAFLNGLETKDMKNVRDIK